MQRLSGSASLNAYDPPGRSPFAKDHARLLHTAAFRRLQGKTQLFPGSESDFFRNRLTHSLEVAQIAVSIAGQLSALHPEAFGADGISNELIQFAAIAHDLGHPPFGHNGEDVLDELMKAHGGFEGNAQTLHMLVHVEQRLVKSSSGRLDEQFGLDLTYRSLAAVLKYVSPIAAVRPPDAPLAKGYYGPESEVVQQVMAHVAPDVSFTPDREGSFRTIECAIMDLADDIAYSTFDLEDSLRANVLTPLTLMHALVRNRALQATVLQRTNRSLHEVGHPAIDAPRLIRAAAKLLEEGLEVVRHVGGDPMDPAPDDAPTQALIDMVDIHALDRKLAQHSLARASYLGERIGRLINSIELDPRRQQRFPTHPQLWGVRLSLQAMIEVEMLKHLIFELVTRSPRLAVVEHRGRDVVQQVFQALLNSDGALLPQKWRSRHAAAKAAGAGAERRVVCDYVAGMTDRFASDLHEALFGQGRTIFRTT